MKNVSPKSPWSLIPVAVTVLSMLFHQSLSFSDNGSHCYVAYATKGTLYIFILVFCTKTSNCMFVYVFQCLKCTCLECKLYVLFCAGDVPLKCFTYAILKCKHKEGKKKRINEKM